MHSDSKDRLDREVIIELDRKAWNLPAPPAPSSDASRRLRSVESSATDEDDSASSDDPAAA
jgi:hypothetical protein